MHLWTPTHADTSKQTHTETRIHMYVRDINTHAEDMYACLGKDFVCGLHFCLGGCGCRVSVQGTSNLCMSVLEDKVYIQIII